LNEPHGLFTAYERESIRKMGQALQQQAKHFGKLHQDNAEVSGLMLAVYKLGLSVERFSALNGHMEIWATFVPEMFSTTSGVAEEANLSD